jgi:hypothetical protein
MYGVYGWGSAIVLLQIVCIVHAIRNHNAGWIWIILFFPLIGSVIYLATEARGVSRSGRKLAGQLVDVVQPTRKLEALRAKLEHAPTVNNRLALAEELVRHKQYEEALKLYETSGSHKDDPEVLKQRAIALFEMGNAAAARETLDHLFEVAPRDRTPAVRLLYARVVEALGDVDEALEAYDAARPGSLGDEARCRHAGVLERAGRTEDAHAIYSRIVKEATHADARYRRENREWIQIAKAKLDESTAKRR